MVSLHRSWEYRFWTDSDNRNLIETVYPDSLAMFDGSDLHLMK